MKKSFLLIASLCMTVLGAYAQRSYTFNAAALNVDGLPNQDISAIVTTVNLNPDGKNEAGATEFCGILANSGWDIVGFSEDFNYHSYLAAAPASTYYNFGKHSGSITTNLTQAFTRAKIDGLGIAVAKRMSFTGDTSTGLQEQWGTEYGGSGLTTIGDNGADNMITKGFRMYTVTIADGVAVDVYILHMDANTADSDDDYDSNGKDKNIVAREAQLKQLADHIKNNHNNRPVIVLGDTNCRYTREALKTGFIDYINADSRFTIKDAWVEHIWGGKYPTYGSGSIMTSEYGMQRGEVVDKIFYINTTESRLTLKSNSYLHDASVTVSDHKPVVVNFTLTDPNGTPLTDAEKENNWTLEESVAGNKKPVWEGEQVVSGTDYYLMNVATNEYIRVGGAYYTQAITGNAALKITPTTANGGSTWVLNTYRGCSLGTGDYAYTDQSGEWYLEQVEGTAYQYRLRNMGGTYLTATTSNEHPVRNLAGNASDDHQKWVFLTDARIRTEMTKANADYPFNFTALLKSADFDVIEFEDGWTAQGWTGFDQANGPFMGVGTGWGGDASQYVSYAYANSTNATTMSQSLGTLPNGTYNISFEGFYRSRYKPSGWFTSEQDETRDAAVTFGSTKIAIPQNKSTTIGSGADVVGPLFRDADTYHKSQQVTLASSSPVTLSVTKPATSSSAKGAWICIDNFRLIYYGTGAAPTDPYKEYKDKVCAKVNETYPLVMALNAAGQAAYDITTVISRYNNDQITTSTEAQAMCDLVDAAYANALAAHNIQLVKDAINGDGNVTALITNPSFETGNHTGWETGGAVDLGVYPNSNGTYTMSGCDGTYVFNAWSGDDGHTSYVKQTISGIPSGLYELKAVLASFGTADGKDHDYHMYLIGNDYHCSVAAVGGKTVGQEATLYFLVEDGTATIGAIGGNKGGGTEFIHYWPWEGCFLKADNFRLRYICDASHGRLKLALNEAEAAPLDEYGQEALNISKYKAMYDNKSLTTDGTAEAAAVRSALQVAAKAQRTAETDMTWAITNPSFETGDLTGWNTIVRWDTGARPQENGTYTIAGTDGRYMFNTWNNAADATESGVNAPITQTVTGIPNGRYILKAMVATDAGNNMYLAANGETATIEASGNGASSGVFPSVECEVTNHTLDIEVGGVNNCWYKCDDFHLTFLGNALTLDEGATSLSDINDWYTSVSVKRTIKPNTWSTFVVPFDIPASALSEWEIKELVSSEINGENVTLTFDDAKDGIKAGVPYMVRNTTMLESLTAINMENVNVNTTLNNTSTNDVIFEGTYTSGNIPLGAFFISGNKFYRATNSENPDKIKGYRAYIVPQAANIRSISYRIGEEGTSEIEVPTEGTTIVAIYNLKGMRISDMQQGMNILQMSDGSIVKVMIK